MSTTPAQQRSFTNDLSDCEGDDNHETSPSNASLPGSGSGSSSDQAVSSPQQRTHDGHLARLFETQMTIASSSSTGNHVSSTPAPRPVGIENVHPGHSTEDAMSMVYTDGGSKGGEGDGKEGSSKNLGSVERAEGIEKMTIQPTKPGEAGDLKSSEKEDEKSEAVNTPNLTSDNAIKPDFGEQKETAKEDKTSTFTSEVASKDTVDGKKDGPESTNGTESGVITIMLDETEELGGARQDKNTELATDTRDQVIQEIGSGTSRIQDPSNGRAGTPALFDDSKSVASSVPRIRNLFRATTRGKDLSNQNKATFLDLEIMLSQIWLLIRLYDFQFQLDEEDVEDIKGHTENVVQIYGQIKKQLQAEVDKLEEVKKYLPTLERLDEPTELQTAIKIWEEKVKEINPITNTELRLYNLFADLYDSTIYIPFLQMTHAKPMPEEWDIPAHLSSIYDVVADVLVQAKAYHADTEKLKNKIKAVLRRLRENPEIGLADYEMEKAKVEMEKWLGQGKETSSERGGWVMKDITFNGRG